MVHVVPYRLTSLSPLYARSFMAVLQGNLLVCLQLWERVFDDVLWHDHQGRLHHPSFDLRRLPLRARLLQLVRQNGVHVVVLELPQWKVQLGGRDELLNDVSVAHHAVQHRDFANVLRQCCVHLLGSHRVSFVARVLEVCRNVWLSVSRLFVFSRRSFRISPCLRLIFTTVTSTQSFSCAWQWLRLGCVSCHRYTEKYGCSCGKGCTTTCSRTLYKTTYKTAYKAATCSVCPCAAGYYNTYGKTAASSSCSSCSGGKYSSSGSSSCSTCSAGYYCPSGTSSQKACPGGYVANPSLSYMPRDCSCFFFCFLSRCRIGLSYVWFDFFVTAEHQF